MAYLGSNGIELPMKLLQQKIKLSAPGLFGAHYKPKLLHMTFCPHDFFGNVTSVRQIGSFLSKPHRVKFNAFLS